MNTNSLAIFFFVLSYLAITLSVNVCELLFLPFPFISVDNASYRKVKLLQKISQISNAKRNTSSYMSTIVQDNTSLMQYTTFKNDKEYNAFNRYLQQRKSVTIFLSDKMTSGFANRFRAMRGLFILAILNNASFCVKYENYFSIMDDQLKVLKCKPNITGQYWDQPYVVNKFRSNPCDYHIYHNTEIRTNNDITMFIAKCKKYSNDIKRASVILKTNHLHSSISEFLFRPKPYIIRYGNSILSNMKGLKVGIQLRFGGGIASTNENYTFLNPNRMDIIIRLITNVIPPKRTACSVFLSSDSPAAQKMLSPLNLPILTAEKFQIGHTNRNNYSYYERAITDLYILSNCDILFNTYWSSFGQIAKDLSRARQCYELRN